MSNREKYDQWSRYYDEYPNPTVAIDELSFPGFWDGLTHKELLEVGCGTGRHTVKLAALGNRITAVEPSPGMLSMARQKLQGTDVTFLEGSFTDPALPLPAGSFDAVIESLVLEHIADLTVFFRRAAEVLRPGGELYQSEIHPSRASSGILAHFRDPATGEEIALESYAHTSGEIEGAAAAAGFELREACDVPGDERLARMRPAWERYLGMDMIRMWRFGLAG